MFGLFKPKSLKKLQKVYKKKMEEAMWIQRSGDLKLYAQKIEESEKLAAEIERLANQ